MINLIRPRFEWLTTAESPRARVTTEPSGWKFHAVDTEGRKNFRDIASFGAACGLTPRYGWSLDLYTLDRCARCLLASGRACLECRGLGYHPRPYRQCKSCITDGLSPEGRKAFALAERLASRRLTARFHHEDDDEIGTFHAVGMAPVVQERSA